MKKGGNSILTTDYQRPFLENCFSMEITALWNFFFKKRGAHSLSVLKTSCVFDPFGTTGITRCYSIPFDSLGGYLKQCSFITG